MLFEKPEDIGLEATSTPEPYCIECGFDPTAALALLTYPFGHFPHGREFAFKAHTLQHDILLAKTPYLLSIPWGDGEEPAQRLLFKYDFPSSCVDPRVIHGGSMAMKHMRHSVEMRPIVEAFSGKDRRPYDVFGSILDFSFLWWEQERICVMDPSGKRSAVTIQHKLETEWQANRARAQVEQLKWKGWTKGKKSKNPTRYRWTTLPREQEREAVWGYVKEQFVQRPESTDRS